jgi:hypothetical protein
MEWDGVRSLAIWPSLILGWTLNVLTSAARMRCTFQTSKDTPCPGGQDTSGADHWQLDQLWEGVSIDAGNLRTTFYNDTGFDLVTGGGLVLRRSEGAQYRLGLWQVGIHKIQWWEGDHAHLYLKERRCHIGRGARCTVEAAVLATMTINHHFEFFIEGFKADRWAQMPRNPERQRWHWPSDQGKETVLHDLHGNGIICIEFV